MAARLRKTRPGIRILLMSGYTAGSLPDREESGEDIDFIQKPFSPQTLLARLQEILHPSGN